MVNPSTDPPDKSQHSIMEDVTVWYACFMNFKGIQDVLFAYSLGFNCSFTVGREESQGRNCFHAADFVLNCLCTVGDTSTTKNEGNTTSLFIIERYLTTPSAKGIVFRVPVFVQCFKRYFKRRIVKNIGVIIIRSSSSSIYCCLSHMVFQTGRGFVYQRATLSTIRHSDYIMNFSSLSIISKIQKASAHNNMRNSGSSLMIRIRVYHREFKLIIHPRMNWYFKNMIMKAFIIDSSIITKFSKSIFWTSNRRIRAPVSSTMFISWIFPLVGFRVYDQTCVKNVYIKTCLQVMVRVRGILSSESGFNMCYFISTSGHGIPSWVPAYIKFVKRGVKKNIGFTHISSFSNRSNPGSLSASSYEIISIWIVLPSQRKVFMIRFFKDSFRRMCFQHATFRSRSRYMETQWVYVVHQENSGVFSDLVKQVWFITIAAHIQTSTRNYKGNYLESSSRDSRCE